MRGHVAAALILAGISPWLLPASAAKAAASPVAVAADDDDDDDDDEEGRPKGPRLAPGHNLGLILTLSRGTTADARPARLVALAVPEGTPPSAFLPPGPFRATWEGDLASPFRSEFDFAAAGRGTIKVEVNGKVALEGSGEDLSKLKGKTAKLKKGANALVVTYDSPDAGDAAIRLSWSSEDFPREPISTTILSHDAAVAKVVEGSRLREGRELLANLHCLQCHAGPSPAPSGGMPELAMDAPNLDDAGSRLRAGWMARWIDDPRSLRPTATMPRVFHGRPAIAAGTDLAAAPAPSDPARDLAAYLATLSGGKADAEEPPAPAATVAAGGRLFAGLGCVGCHTLPDRADWASAANRVPLRFVGAKWKSKALRAFLLRPDAHYAWIKMPNFHLTEDEATKLAAYVASGPSTDLATAGQPAGDPARGKALFASSGCVNCHAAKTTPAGAAPAPALAAIPADGWARGCLDPASTPSRKAPDFGLGDGPRQALKAFATSASAPASLAREAAPEFAERQIKALRCAACHKRDGYDDAWTDLQPEVANLAADANAGALELDPEGHPYPALQARPPLTWIGEKLKPEWSAAFIAGKLDHKPRPYLKARMPGFPARAEGLSVGLSLEHGYAAGSPPDPASDPAQVPDAKALVKSTGLNCVSCHKVGNLAAVGVFEAPGINFMEVKERLRKDYYDRWIRSPMRVDPDTKMPSFFNGEASVLPTILGGRADKQAEALWNYLLQGRAIEAPGS